MSAAFNFIDGVNPEFRDALSDLNIPLIEDKTGADHATQEPLSSWKIEYKRLKPRQRDTFKRVLEIVQNPGLPLDELDQMEQWQFVELYKKIRGDRNPAQTWREMHRIFGKPSAIFPQGIEKINGCLSELIISVFSFSSEVDLSGVYYDINKGPLLYCSYDPKRPDLFSLSFIPIDQLPGRVRKAAESVTLLMIDNADEPSDSDYTCSAVHVGNGQFLTASHCLDEQVLSVKMYKGSSSSESYDQELAVGSPRVLSRLTGQDLVLFEIPGSDLENLPSAKISKRTTRKFDDIVYHVGFPTVYYSGDQGKKLGSVGTIFGFENALLYPDSMRITNLGAPGSSGGAIFSPDGKLIGISVAAVLSPDVEENIENIEGESISGGIKIIDLGEPVGRMRSSIMSPRILRALRKTRD